MLKEVIIIFTLMVIVSFAVTAFASNFTIDKSFLPYINFPWLLIKHDKENTMSSDSEIPRIPEIIYEKDVSVDLDVDLATPLIYEDKIVLADHEGIYVLNEKDGELIWGAELFFDQLHNRKVKNPQPWTKWRAYGLQEFVQSYGIGKHLYVATSNSNRGSLLAFDIKNGNLLWRVQINASITSNIIVGQDKIFLGTIHTDGKVYCYSEDGELLWITYIGGNVRGLTLSDFSIFASSEHFKKLYAIDINSGKIKWIYESKNILTSPVYKEGLIILGDASGNLIALSEEGKLLWEKSIGIQSSVDGYTYLAVGKNSIYASSILDGKNYLVILSLSGDEIGRFRFSKEQDLGFPVVTKKILIIPTKAKDVYKIYLFWKRIKIHEIEIDESSVWLPKVSVAYGNLYVTLQTRDGRYRLLKLGDNEKPIITSVSVKDTTENYLEIEVRAYDRQSGIYKVILSYKIDNLEKVYTEMNIGRRYFIEPIGGYGLAEEVYVGRIHCKKGASVKYAVIIIDNVGNCLLSDSYYMLSN